MPDLFTLERARAGGAEDPKVNERHVVGEDIALYVLLREVPLEGGTMVVTVDPDGAPSNLTLVATTPASGEARVHYSGRLMGWIEFHADQAGATVDVDYDGRGAAASAAWHNRVKDKLQGERTIADGATVTLEYDDELVCAVTLGGNRTIEVGAFPPAGAVCVLKAIQDATGSRVPTFDAADFDGGTAGLPTLSTAANAIDLLSFYSTGTKLLYIGSALGFS